MTYTTRATKLTVMPEGEPIFSDMATSVTIEDDSTGEFVSVRQTACQLKNGEIQINPEEWPALRAAIDDMIGECK